MPQKEKEIATRNGGGLLEIGEKEKKEGGAKSAKGVITEGTWQINQVQALGEGNEGSGGGGSGLGANTKNGL